jgi:hypothetical protein
MSDFENSYARHRDLRANANALNKAVVFDALAAAGITSVVAEFDGGGDSGQIDDILAYAGDNRVDFPSTNIKLHSADWGQQELCAKEASHYDAVEDLCYGFLEQTHAGWENNDGAYGQFTFDVAGRKIELDFNGRFTDTWSDAHTF